MTDFNIPTGIDQITPVWLTQALQEAFPGVMVTGAEFLGVLHGSAAKVRLNVTCTGRDDVPGSFVVKGAFTAGLGADELAQAWIPLMALMNETEGRFYTGDASVMGHRVPRCYFARASGTDSVLILEDLNNRPNMRFGTFDRPLSADEMAGVLHVLADLHAVRWHDPSLASRPLRDSFREGGMLDGFLSEVNWEQQMRRSRRSAVPRELEDHAFVTNAIRMAWVAKRSGPQSLIHGDPHTGNHFFDDSGAGLLDWQLFTSGHWASDVVYAVASAMDIEDRRKHEEHLLRDYLERIAASTRAAPSWDEAWRDYRKFAIWGVAALLTPGEGVQAEEYNTVVGGRHAQAAVDLDSISVLKASVG
ncbi:MAG: phosphotransferase [Pseudomonadaceae bacterium]